MAKSTISMAIFNSFLYVYQRVWYMVYSSTLQESKVATDNLQFIDDLHFWVIFQPVWLTEGTSGFNGQNQGFIWKNNKYI